MSIVLVVSGLETVQSLTVPNLRHYLAHLHDTNPPFSNLCRHTLSNPQYSRRKPQLKSQLSIFFYVAEPPLCQDQTPCKNPKKTIVLRSNTRDDTCSETPTL